METLRACWARGIGDWHSKHGHGDRENTGPACRFEVIREVRIDIPVHVEHHNTQRERPVPVLGEDVGVERGRRVGWTALAPPHPIPGVPGVPQGMPSQGTPKKGLEVNGSA